VRRIAVVGAGIAGLAAARGLARSDRVTLFEAADHFGGHAHTVDFTLGGRTHGVDTAFVVYNERAHPNVAALVGELGVGTATAEMSFSAQIPSARIEWSSAGIGSVFAQRSNLLRPAFWNMLGEVRRFRDIAARLLARDSERNRATLDDGLGDFLQARRFSGAFRDWYLLPIVATIWSCPPEQMLRFPLGELLRFCARHGLRQVRRLPGGGVEVATANGSERFDAVVLACHSDQALALLADPGDDEREVLGAIRWQRNRAVLHSDVRVLPSRKAAWAAWNYERSASREAGEAGAVCVHVLVNRLQPLPFDAPAIVSLNPLFEPTGKLVQGEFHYAHPLFDRRAIAAQARLPALQGQRGTWYCGAWTGRGSHEDGLVSALAVCRSLQR